MLANVTHILPLTAIRRERVLPVRGRVVARKGQQVNPGDVVAEANLTPEHLWLDVARGLGLPVQEADTHIQCQTGDEVREDDVIAGPVGLGRRVVRTPRSGVVVVAGGGQVLVEIDNPPYELRAGYSGVIADLIPERGVVIETVGALIQGTWGNGRINFGLLNIEIESPEDEITPNRLDVSLRGSVVLGGYCGEAEALELAEELPLRGLILASMDSALVPVANKMRYPIILIEGFGRLPMSQTAYKLLSTSERRDVSLNAERWDRFTNTRPEIVIPLPSEYPPESPPEAAVFTAGQRVRVASPPYKAMVGTLVTVYPGLTLLPSGLRAAAADVSLEEGKTVVLPLANLEALE